MNYRYILLIGLVILASGCTREKAQLVVNVQTLELTFLGDIMAHDVNYSRKPYNLIWNGVESNFLKDDLTFGNMEFVVDKDKPQESYPTFNQIPEYPNTAIAAGVDVFSASNNHMLDQGLESLQKTICYLDSTCNGKMIHSGLREKPDGSFIIKEISKNNLKIGFIALSQISNVHENIDYMYFLDYNDKKEAGQKKINDFLAFIKEKSSLYDLMIVSVHAGGEYKLAPEESKRVFFDKLVNSGVDIVWGHHPHVLQPRKIIKTNDGDKLIIYSTGNFISGMSWTIDYKKPDPHFVDTSESSITKVFLTFTDKKSIQMKVEEIPIFNYRENGGAMVVKTGVDLLNRKDLKPYVYQYYKTRFEVVSKFLEPELQNDCVLQEKK